jgi:hypothetical protein
MIAARWPQAVRLTFRIHRFETVLVLGATILAVLVSALVLAWMNANDYGSCLSNDGSEPFRAVCRGSFGGWMSRIVRLSIAIVPVFPFVAGILIGPQLVGRELDSGTARLAWSLGPSRMRWFVQRVLPAFILVILCGFVIGVVSDALQGFLAQGTDLSQSFAGYRTRGVMIAAEAGLVAAIGLFAGALLGRPVPAFIVALVLGGALMVGIDKVDRTMLAPEAVVRGECCNDTDLYIDGRYQLPDGRLVTWEELYVYDPAALENGPTEPYVALAIPGERYRSIETRGTLILFGAAALFVVAAAVVVVKRRPR